MKVYIDGTGLSDESSNIRNLVEAVYDSLEPEELYSRAKEYSWQTFFHHCVSVALISYRFGEILRNNPQYINSGFINAIYRLVGIKYENLLFYVGLSHDYVKLYGISNKTGEENIRKILGKLLSEEVGLSKSLDYVVEKILRLAMAVEGRYEASLEEGLIRYVSSIVRIADILMSKKSLDEVLPLLGTSDFQNIFNNFGVRFGYIKTAVPSVLHAKVSENLVSIIQRYGWMPLALYADGLLLIGNQLSRIIPPQEVVDLLKSEILSISNPSVVVERIVTDLNNHSKVLKNLYALLKQTNASDIVPLSSTNGKEDNINLYVYHNIIVKYLKNPTDINGLSKEFDDLKRKLNVRIHFFDPRELATGAFGSGSTYFNEFFSIVGVTPDKFSDIILSLGEDKKFLILSYMLAFASDDSKVLKEILNKLTINNVSTVKKEELLRIIAIAEAYRSLNDDDRVRKIVGLVANELKSIDMEPYIKRFISTRIKSNIIGPEPMDLSESLIPNEFYSYCRVCGEPVKPIIKFIQYARDIKGAGGVSEIWLHDDIPLADLEKISTTRTIRHICPLCYYEAYQIKQGFRPPFFIISLHPVIAFDLWSFIKEKLKSVSNIYRVIESKPKDIAGIYEKILLYGNLKLSGDIINELMRAGSGDNQMLLFFDDLGARIILPFGGDMSLKKNVVSFAMALAPFVMSVSGGGQVGLFNTLSDAYNLGIGFAPIYMPHQSPLIREVIATFEKIIERRKQIIDMSLDDYSVYNRSYITILETLLIYGLKVFAWYGHWRVHGKRPKCEDYALQLHEHMSNIPYVPLSLASPPSQALYPDKGDGLPPMYDLILSKSMEVEKYMNEVTKHIEGKSQQSLIGALRSYVSLLYTLRQDLSKYYSKYQVQRPLREAINTYLNLLAVMDEGDAKKIALAKYLQATETVLNINVCQLTERDELINAFNIIMDATLKVTKDLPPARKRKFIEEVLDTAFMCYKLLAC